MRYQRIADVALDYRPDASIAPDLFADINVAPRAISAQNAYLIQDLMRDVIQRGTGRRARVLGRRDLSGKTGTSNDQRDAWFGGFNGDPASVVWVGYDDDLPLGRDHTVVLATHDLERASRVASRAVFLDAGRLCDAGPVERVLGTPASPARLIPPDQSTSPDWYRRGVSPKCAPTSRERVKRPGSSTPVQVALPSWELLTVQPSPKKSPM